MLQNVRKITDTIYWVGGNDRRLALFENLFPIPRGVSYNSYLIMDEKTALMDTVDSSITAQFLENIQSVLGGRTLDYVVVNHMEPDHCASLVDLLRRYPQARVVGNSKTFTIIKQFYALELEGRTDTVAENDTLPLGKHTLQFLMAPMVHWPEVMTSYERQEKILFCADAFGTFGALNGNLFNDEVEFDRDWLPDARRYYTNIVGKYGMQVQALLRKASALDIRLLCPLHGPVWRSDLGYFLEKYDKWSRYEPENPQGVMIVYGSMYGNTENAAEILASSLGGAGVRNVAVYDASRTHVSELIAETFRCSHVLIASPTYNGGIYPAIETYLRDLQSLGVKNRTYGIVENGTWGPVSGKQIRAMLEQLKDSRILDAAVTIKSSLSRQNRDTLQALTEETISSLGI